MRARHTVFNLLFGGFVATWGFYDQVTIQRISSARSTAAAKTYVQSNLAENTNFLLTDSIHTYMHMYKKFATVLGKPPVNQAMNSFWR